MTFILLLETRILKLEVIAELVSTTVYSYFSAQRPPQFLRLVGSANSRTVVQSPTYRYAKRRNTWRRYSMNEMESRACIILLRAEDETDMCAWNVLVSVGI